MHTYLEKEQLSCPQRTWQDDIKWLYQAFLGCEHFISDSQQSLKRIKKECGSGHILKAVALSDAYIRVYFSGLNDTEARVFNRLFIESAQVKAYEKHEFVSFLKDKYSAGSLEDEAAVAAYIASGCPSVHHSDIYKAAYAPHYRVIYRSWWPYFQLLCQVEQLGKGVIGIDGRCGSGKSTLGDLISRLYHCPLIHMDDFYLPLAMRTEARLQEPGGNVYYERFKNEVMLPIERKEALHYGVFDHRIMDVGSYCDVAVSPLYVIEGSYAFHPTLIDGYDLKIFLTIDKEYQRERILKRNGPEVWKMFASRWIPLEEHYFACRDFNQLADIVFKAQNE